MTPRNLLAYIMVKKSKRIENFNIIYKINKNYTQVLLSEYIKELHNITESKEMTRRLMDSAESLIGNVSMITNNTN